MRLWCLYCKLCVQLGILICIFDNIELSDIKMGILNLVYCKFILHLIFITLCLLVFRTIQPYLKLRDQNQHLHQNRAT